MGAPFTAAEVLQACEARRLGAQGPDAFSGVFTDTRTQHPGGLFVALKGERHDAHDFLDAAVAAGAAGLVVDREPRVAGPAVFVVKDTREALGQLARWHRQRFALPVVAVTGSNGKTTTRALIAAMLEAHAPTLSNEGNLNNEVGVPLTLFRLEARHRYAVIEMGMNHPGEIARLASWARPTVGLITCVQPAHLEGLGSIEAVAQAKGELFQALEADGVAVLNADDARVVALGARHPGPTVSFGWAGRQVRLRGVAPGEGAGQQVDLEVLTGDGTQRVQLALALHGVHNAVNAAGALAVGVALGLDVERCVDGLSRMRPAKHRLELTTPSSAPWVLDDCYNANPGSMAAALDTLVELARRHGRRAVAVLGDMLELGDAEAEAHAALGRLAGARAQAVVWVGPASRRAHEVCRPAQSLHVRDAAEAMGALRTLIQPEDLILVKASRGMRLEQTVDALRAPHVTG